MFKSFLAFIIISFGLISFYFFSRTLSRNMLFFNSLIFCSEAKSFPSRTLAESILTLNIWFKFLISVLVSISFLVYVLVKFIHFFGNKLSRFHWVGINFCTVNVYKKETIFRIHCWFSKKFKVSNISTAKLKWTIKTIQSWSVYVTFFQQREFWLGWYFFQTNHLYFLIQYRKL